jgi:hypothetical protein
MNAGDHGMNRNFKFSDTSVIRLGDKFIDLHNAYDLDLLGTDVDANAATLSFSRNQWAINPEALPPKVVLRCSGNVKVAFNNLNLIVAPLNDEGIEIAYFDANCDWDSYIDETIAIQQEPIGLHVNFMNDLIVRIYCETVTFEASWS